MNRSDRIDINRFKDIPEMKSVIDDYKAAEEELRMAETKLMAARAKYRMVKYSIVAKLDEITKEKEDGTRI